MAHTSVWQASEMIQTAYEPRREKTCLRWFANNKGADHPARMHSLISTLVIRLLKSIISKLATGKSSSFLLVSVAGQTGVNLPLSEIPKTCFVRSRPIWAAENENSSPNEDSDKPRQWTSTLSNQSWHPPCLTSLDCLNEGKLKTLWQHLSTQQRLMSRLIWVFAGCKCHFRLIYSIHYSTQNNIIQVGTFRFWPFCCRVFGYLIHIRSRQINL